MNRAQKMKTLITIVRIIKMKKQRKKCIRKTQQEKEVQIDKNNQFGNI
jgi:hypothetical protein